MAIRISLNFYVDDDGSESRPSSEDYEEEYQKSEQKQPALLWTFFTLFLHSAPNLF